MARPRTLRARLSLGIAALVLAVLATVGVVVYYTTARSLAASLDRSLQTATAQAMAGTNYQNGRLTLGPQLDEGVGAGDLPAPGLSLAVFTPKGAALRQYGPYDQSVPRAVALEAARRGVTTSASRGDARSGSRVRVLTTPLQEEGRTLAVFSVALSEGPMLDTLQRLRLTLLVLLPLAAAISAVLGYLLTRRVLRPLARMQATAAEISSHDLSRRLGVAADGDEVSQLAATFDAMLDRLEASFVRERRFVADASHELRTPLAALQTIVSVTRERPRSAGEYEQALDDVDGETARLRTLVEDLLELARGDAEHLAEREPVDVSALLRDVCESLEVLADDKGLTLTCEPGDGLVTEGDGDALLRLFVNLIDNAIKYTDEGGVAVAALAANGTIAITVRDSGRAR
jgi:signal transduction histidine kinase